MPPSRVGHWPLEDVPLTSNNRLHLVTPFASNTVASKGPLRHRNFLTSGCTNGGCAAKTRVRAGKRVQQNTHARALARARGRAFACACACACARDHVPASMRDNDCERRTNLNRISFRAGRGSSSVCLLIGNSGKVPGDGPNSRTRVLITLCF